jgi:flavodoxin
MQALVIYDSKFGNTRQIADAIGRPLGEQYIVRVQSIAETPVLPPNLDLLVIGGPTHAHGLSQPMKQYFKQVPDDAMRGLHVATFDTRFRKPKLLVGAASEGIAKQARKRGAQLVARPESFFVAGGEGPLEPGELERAGAWAQQLAESTAVVS